MGGKTKMFALQIHTDDFPQRLPTTVASVARGPNPRSSAAEDQNGLSPIELRGIAHLFRQLPTPTSASAATILSTSISNPSAPSTLLFIVAVPNYLSSDDILVFCGPDVNHFQEILFLRNDGVGDRYSVHIKLENQLAADGFYCSFNGKKFRPAEAEVCRLCQQQDGKPTCAVCGTLKNLWICLICGFVGCGRYEERHAIKHWSDTQHHYSLELETQQTWDYVGDKYVHRLNQSKADWKSAVMNSQLVSTDLGGGTCGYEEDSGLDGALFSSKVETTVDEYNHLLASQLDIQRQRNQELMKKQELLQQEYKETEARFSLTSKG